jgi:hypothetical protein
MRWKQSIPVLSLSLTLSPTGPAQAATIFNPSRSTVPFLYGAADLDTIINEGNVNGNILGNNGISGEGSDTITNSGMVIGDIFGSGNISLNGSSRTIILSIQA